MNSFYTRINVRIECGVIFFAAVHLPARAQVAHAHLDLFPMSILIHSWSVSYLSAYVTIPC